MQQARAYFAGAVAFALHEGHRRADKSNSDDYSQVCAAATSVTAASARGLSFTERDEASLCLVPQYEAYAAKAFQQRHAGDGTKLRMITQNLL